MSTELFLGLDAGTGSARAGLFDAAGKMHAHASREIKMWKPEPNFVEQSSDDIWRACGEAVRDALSKAGAQPAQVAGIGFDATCSLVVLDANDRPVTISPSGEDRQNIISWMDHRATVQADRINAGGHDVLRFVGGKLSPEMQTPKLLWLKEHLPQSWKRARRFFDLPDYLAYRATGDETRSLCSTVCKMTYLGHELPTDSNSGSLGRWDAGFFRKAGLGELADEGFLRLGKRVRPMGEPLGKGLTEKAAYDLGLKVGTPCGVSIIDAHAGGLGVLGAPLDGKSPRPEDFNTRLALIGGTSSCHLAVSTSPRFIQGVWGPYFSAMVPNLWLTEGGQSATGALIDHIINSHVRAADAHIEARRSNRTIYEVLNARLEQLEKLYAAPFPGALTRELHVFPDFHGNRSPRADPHLRGMISGLRLEDSAEEHALLYLAALQAVAHGTKHILSTLNAQGYKIDTLLACGGGIKNPVFLREHAAITGCRIVLPREPEAILLGAALLGAVAARQYPSVVDAMAGMNGTGGEILPPAPDSPVAKFHAFKHMVFLRMHDDQLAYRRLMAGQRSSTSVLRVN